MANQAFYRKWRSQRFAELVGQEHVTRTLRNAVATNRVAHAYAFCGPRGVGKTSAARILAKAVNCRRSVDGEPCDECDTCVAMHEGRLLDVIEIDAASNRGIEDIRELRERVHFAPTYGRSKFYILDEAHMLTNESFNALLKTLEEPPPHAVFVLVTTEAQKLPPTVLSRCQRLDFRRVSLRAMLDRLLHICAQEGITVEPAALDAIARSATGSLRDAESLLDQLVSFSGPDIRLEQVRAIVGLAGWEAARQLIAAALEGDVAAGIRLIDRLASEGTDLRRYAQEVADYARGLLLLRIGEGLADLVDVSPEALVPMREMASRASVEALGATIRLFAQGDAAARSGVSPQLALELALVDASRALGQAGEPSLSVAAEPRRHPERARDAPSPRPSVAPPGQGQKAKRANGETPVSPLPRFPVSPTPDPDAPSPRRPVAPSPPTGGGAAEPPLAATASSTPRPERAPAPESSPLPPPGPSATEEGTGRKTGERVEPTTRETRTSDMPPASVSAGVDWERIVRDWKRVVHLSGTKSKSIQALLRDVTPDRLDGTTLVLRSRFEFHQKTLERPDTRSVVEGVLEELYSSRLTIRCVVGPPEEGDKPVVTDPVDGAQADPRVRAALEAGYRVVHIGPGEREES